MDISKPINERLKNMGWTHYRLAKVTGIAPATIYSMRDGGNVDNRTLDKIASALGLEVWQIVKEASK